MIIRHELNILNHAETSGVSEEIVALNTVSYNGAITYYFEIVGSVTSGTATITLRRSGTSTDDATISLSATTPTHLRSSSFTPPAGSTAYVVNVTGGTGPSVKIGRIIIIQDTGLNPITDSESQFEIGAYETSKSNETVFALTNPKYWLYDSRNWDGTLTFNVEVVWKGSGTMYAKTIILEEDDGSFDGWVTNTTIVNASTSGTLTRTRVTFTPKHGRNYRISSFIADNMETYDIYCAKIIVTQTNTITEFEEQYLLINSSQTSPGLRNFQTLFDSISEWSGMNNIYISTIDGSATPSSSFLSGTNNIGDLLYSRVSGLRQKRGEVIQSFTGGQTVTMPGHQTGFAQTYLCNLSGGGNIIGAEVLLSRLVNDGPISGYLLFDFVSGNNVSGPGFWSSFNVTGTGITNTATRYQFYFDSGVNLASGTSGYLRMFRSLPTGTTTRLNLVSPEDANSTYRPQFYWTQTKNIWTENSRYIDFRPIVSINISSISGLVDTNLISS